MKFTRVLLKFFILFCLLANSAIAHSKGIILIGNPRGLTTAFERYMINRGDFKVYHEPIVTHTYSKIYPSDFQSPFAADCSTDCVLQQISAENTGPFFIKEIASFVVDSKALIELAKESKVQVIFLIRKPEPAVLSHFKLRSASPWITKFNVSEQEANYIHMQKLFFELKATLNKTPILIEADDLVNNPKQVLSKLCSQLEIPFNEQALQWSSGESSLWENDVSSWQYNVTNSTGFKKMNTLHSLKGIPIAHRTKLKKLISDNNIIYEQLIKYKS